MKSRYSPKKTPSFTEYQVNILTDKQVKLTYEKYLLMRQIQQSGIYKCWTVPHLLPKADKYVQVFVKGFSKKFLWHHIAWRYWNRTKIPPGKIIAHRCSNPGCGKYTHLRCVSKQVNEEMKDCFYVREANTKKLLLICKHTPKCKPPVRVRSIAHSVKSKITLAFQD
jgi:hypothetical protein